jgi:hypothetical protein
MGDIYNNDFKILVFKKFNYWRKYYIWFTWILTISMD